jgi:hypothetical protein
MSFSDVYKIGVNLALTGDAPKKLNLFNRAVKTASESTSVLTSRLKPLNNELRTMGSLLQTLNPRLSRFTVETGGTRNALTSVNTSLSGFNKRIDTSINRVSVLSTRAAKLTAELSGIAVMGDAAAVGIGAVSASSLPLIGGGGRRSGGGRVGGSSGGRKDPFGLMFAGAVPLFGVDRLYRESKKYMQAQAEFSQINLGDAQNKIADNYAKNLNLEGVSSIEALKTLRDSVVVMGDTKHAMEIAPVISKMQFANNALFSGSGIKIGESQYQDLLRVVEIRGGFKSTEEMIKQIDYGQHVISGTGGRVLFNQYLNLLKTGGVAAQHLDNEVLYYGLEPLIQELGGFRVGTGLMSIYQTINSGKMTTAAAMRWQKLGLLKKGGAEYTSIGTIKRIKKGGVKNNELASTDILKYIYDVYLPALAKAGINTESEILQEIAYDFGNRTAANLVSKIYLQRGKIEKNMAIDKNAMGSEESYAAALKTAIGTEENFASQWSRFKVAIGEPITPTILSGISALTVVFKTLADEATEFPRVAGNITLLVTSLATLAISRASYILIAGSLHQLALGLGFTSIGGALGLSKIATGFRLISVGLLALLPMLGPIAALALAGAAAYKIAGSVKSNTDALKSAGKFSNPGSLSNQFSNLLHPSNNLSKYNTTPSASRNGGSQINNVINIDGKKVADIVTHHQVKAARSPNYSTRPDGSMTPFHNILTQPSY